MITEINSIHQFLVKKSEKFRENWIINKRKMRFFGLVMISFWNISRPGIENDGTRRIPECQRRPQKERRLEDVAAGSRP